MTAQKFRLYELTADTFNPRCHTKIGWHTLINESAVDLTDEEAEHIDETANRLRIKKGIPSGEFSWAMVSINDEGEPVEVDQAMSGGDVLEKWMREEQSQSLDVQDADGIEQ
jgi:hypothetical protein